MSGTISHNQCWDVVLVLSATTLLKGVGEARNKVIHESTIVEAAERLRERVCQWTQDFYQYPLKISKWYQKRTKMGQWRIASNGVLYSFNDDCPELNTKRKWQNIWRQTCWLLSPHCFIIYRKEYRVLLKNANSLHRSSLSYWRLLRASLLLTTP